MAKGLSKAERHAIRLWVRSFRFLMAIELLQMPRWLRRMVMAEMRKRHWVHEDWRDIWRNPRYL